MVNPRHRRWLIPGLLIALIVVVVVAALTGRADADTAAPVVRIGDSRITESSGLAVSAKDPDLAYTVNDSGHAPIVFAIDLTTGAVVGTTRLAARPADVEALALAGGTLWIADLGDNAGVRTDTALYAIDEPGRASGTVRPRRYGLDVPDGADVEALLAAPDGDLFVVTKGLAGGSVYAVTGLSPGGSAGLRHVADGLPSLVTDGAVSPDGRRVALLTYLSIVTVDARDWDIVGSQALPSGLEQAETLAFLPGDRDRVLVGSEGRDSPLFAVTLDPASDQGPPSVATVSTVSPGSTASPSAAATVAADPSAGEPAAAPASGETRSGLLWGVGGAAAILALAAWGVLSRRRR